MKRKKVINRPGAASRARVDCRQSSSQSSSQSRFVKPVFCSQSTCAGARAREARHPAIFDPEAYFRVWRVAKFGDDFDPVKVAVDEAVAAFSQRKDADGQGQDVRRKGDCSWPADAGVQGTLRVLASDARASRPR